MGAGVARGEHPAVGAVLDLVAASPGVLCALRGGAIHALPAAAPCPQTLPGAPGWEPLQRGEAVLPVCLAGMLPSHGADGASPGHGCSLAPACAWPALGLLPSAGGPAPCCPVSPHARSCPGSVLHAWGPSPLVSLLLPTRAVKTAVTHVCGRCRPLPTPTRSQSSVPTLCWPTAVTTGPDPRPLPREGAASPRPAPVSLGWARACASGGLQPRLTADCEHGACYAGQAPLASSGLEPEGLAERPPGLCH